MTSVGVEDNGRGLPCCRECGAPAAASDKTCAYCRSPLATLQCAHCFNWNVGSAAHCLECGERLGLGRVPAQENAATPCPGCRSPMLMYRDDDGQLWDCPSCEAQFVEHRLLDSLLAGRQRLSAREVVKPHPLPLSTKITYYPCPQCSHLMNRRNFGGRSGIVVDVCRTHGVWFEASELRLVLEFVESGGLAEARRASLGLPAPTGLGEQQRMADAIARSLERPRVDLGSPDVASEQWSQWAFARLDELVRLYLSWSRR